MTPPSDLAKRLAKRVADLRALRGLTQAELAEKLGTSKGYISDIEAAKKLPSLEMLARIAKVLGVADRDLL